MLRLKSLLATLNLPQARLAAACGISTAAAAQLVNRDRWPVKGSQDALRSRIEAFLREHGAQPSQIGRAFEVVPDVSKQPEEESLMLLRKQTLTPAARQHFRLTRNPFDEVSTSAEVWQNETIRFTRAAMLDAAKRGGFMAVIGESGSGKSTLRRDLIERITQDGEPVRIIQPYSILGMDDRSERGNVMRATHIAEAILAEIAPHMRVPSSSETRFRKIHQELQASHQAGNRHVLIIEEAHALPIATLKHLKRFTELEVGFTKLLSILLIGQPELAEKLSEQNASVREVVQRCEVVTLPSLGSDLPEYLAFRFKAAGVQLAQVLDASAVHAIHTRLAPPVPRGHVAHTLLYPLAVHNLTTAALNLAAAHGAPVVCADIIHEV